jgi:predicted nucleotidyltransferase
VLSLGIVPVADFATEALVAALRAGPPLRLAMLFGSAAAGALRPDSDVDVAILPADPDLSLADELDLQARLARACAREVDLCRLDRASTLVRWQVASHGRALLASSPFEAPRFVAAAASEYLDFAPSFTRAAERFRLRLAAGRKA